MKKILLTIILLTLVLPVMADTSKDLERILVNKELAKEISVVLNDMKKQTNQEPMPSYDKANKALEILGKQNPSLKPLIRKVQNSHNNLINFLNSGEYPSKDGLKQTCEYAFYYLEDLALNIWEIEKVNKNLARTIEKIVDHQYYFKAISLEVNIRGLIFIITGYYKPTFYNKMAIAQSPLLKQESKTGYDWAWENFINTWLTENSN